MPRKKVYLRSAKEMPRAVSHLERVVYGEILKALRKTARYAETKAVQTARATKPKPLAHGAYMSAWGVQETSTGAIMGNSAYHSYFVEVGRKPGRRPPLAPIIDWISAKRISQRRMKGILGYKKVQVDRLTKKGGRPYAWMKNPKARSKARRRRTNRLKREKLVRSYAFYVQYVIGKYGTRGRYVLRRAMPAIQRRFKRELRKSLQQAISKYHV